MANRAIQDCVSRVCSHSTYYCGPQALQGYKLTWRLWSQGYNFSALQDTNGLTSNLNSTLFPQCLLTTRVSNVPRTSLISFELNKCLMCSSHISMSHASTFPKLYFHTSSYHTLPNSSQTGSGTVTCPYVYRTGLTI